MRVMFRRQESFSQWFEKYKKTLTRIRVTRLQPSPWPNLHGKKEKHIHVIATWYEFIEQNTRNKRKRKV